MAMKSDRYWVIDVEGSGGKPPEIIELAMLEISDLALTGNQRHWFVRPQRSIEPSATRIHGLTDDDVIGAPSIEDIADDVLQWLDDARLSGICQIDLEITAIDSNGRRAS